MKPVFMIAIVAVTMIGVMVPSVFAEFTGMAEEPIIFESKYEWEKEHPMFKEVVKLAITPMISSLSLMENANSESEVLGIGLSVIMLNLGMYLGVPAVLIVGIKRKF